MEPQLSLKVTEKLYELFETSYNEKTPPRQLFTSFVTTFLVFSDAQKKDLEGSKKSVVEVIEKIFEFYEKNFWTIEEARNASTEE